jgi:nitroimidazol reductase NimA-like FMN-containing flavoprotein (pyridoxamine 5'-phosphate oxidase superfamily)
MRRQDKEIKDPETLKRILDKAEYITVAMCDGEEPYLVPLSHQYDAERNCIYFHSASAGKKLDILKKNPRVWGQAIDDHGYHEGQCSHLYASVMFRGRVEWVTDDEEKRAAFTSMAHRLDKEPEKLIKGLKSLSTPGGLTPVVVGKINVEEMTGKKSAEVSP